MASALLRLLALLALLVMPMGMAGAPAFAAPVDHRAMTDAGHCGEEPGEDRTPAQTRMDCTAACTALPVSPGPVSFPAPQHLALRTAAIVTPFTGIVLEIATPPPRFA